ncbi:MAG TPA: pentapeptide repeat-containing protein, partial [Allocoleopsis sp.]
GRVKFGLKGVNLQLILENANFTQTVYPSNSLLIIDNNSNDKQQLKVIYPEINNNIYSGGKNNWRLGVNYNKLILNGQLSKLNLGRIKAEKNDVYITAKIKVELADIDLTDAEGLWKHDITPNKHGILERKLALFLLKTRFLNHLSTTVISTEKMEKEPVNYLINNEDEEELGRIITKVSESKTDDLIKLATLGNLSPLTDLTGGMLMGTNLRGIDLSEANLYRVNLRGADLTDADLSEANLRGAKLNGADLSGAYLENVDLRNADLHNASLALVNLIGADLRGANLEQTNLTDVHLTNAQLQGARFGNNQGIAAEMKLELLNRGGIFKES